MGIDWEEEQHSSAAFWLLLLPGVTNKPPISKLGIDWGSTGRRSQKKRSRLGIDWESTGRRSKKKRSRLGIDWGSTA